MTFKKVSASSKEKELGNGISGKWPASVLFFMITGISTLMLHADTGRLLEVGKFSTASPADAYPAGWEPLTFKKIKKHTAYSLVEESGTVVVKAESKSSASGLVRKISIDPQEFPRIAWRWKVTRVYAAGDVSKKDGDDYPARLYITFEYDPTGLSFLEKAKYEAIRLFYGEYPPVGALNYIWESKAPKGAFVPNPYTDRVMMIVVESGESGLNTWIAEERNLLEDYRRAFGKDPPAISGVAIMTDTDNTGESAVAYYGDIVFKKK